MRHRSRNTVSAVLVALACLFAPCGVLAGWAAYGLADTGRYVATMAPLAGDPAVREAVADAVRDGVLAEVAAGSPADTGAVPPLGTVGPFVHDAARSFTRTEAFRAGWEAGNRAAHDAVLRALRGHGGPATVDLAAVTTPVKRQLVQEHVPLAERIPVRHTAVTVLPAREVGRLRRGYQLLDVAAFWLPLAAVAFAVTGIAVAARRRVALTAAGLGTAAGGALLALAVLLGRRLTVAAPPGTIPSPAAGAVYDALTATLRTAAWCLVALGLTVSLATWLTSRLRRPRTTTPPQTGGPTGP
ncbi:hypothetical protein [Streptomyces sp. NPDC003717]|uniref:hypothetical protein n=1 Tax=Streptomyces sp. NPDC003717 TaxID=3154276 RepID=UPI0033A4D180